MKARKRKPGIFDGDRKKEKKKESESRPKPYAEGNPQ
jgi:hypothetical protein